jgi:glucose-1-phosphate cytidylyltransferase
VSDVNFEELLKFHSSHGKLATLTAIQPEGRFGKLGLDGDAITQFSEKKDNDDNWINGGFMVLNKKVLDYIP